MKTKSSYGNSKALGLCFLGAMASTSHAQLQSAGSLLVDLNFTTLTPGDLPFVANAGTLGGGFESFGPAAAIPVIRAAPKTAVKGLYVDGGDFMMSVTAQTPIGGIPTRLDAPAGLIGAQASRSVEAWVYNESLADEETAVAWGNAAVLTDRIIPVSMASMPRGVPWDNGAGRIWAGPGQFRRWRAAGTTSHGCIQGPMRKGWGPIRTIPWFMSTGS